MVKKQIKISNKIKIGTAAVCCVGIVAAGYLLNSSYKTTSLQLPYYTVSRVIDGDTFVTEEDQNIRISSTEAPELDQCGGPVAKQALEKLVLGKKIYLKVIYTDIYRRFISLVYTKDAFINEEMLRSGYSYYYRTSPGTIGETLKKATDEARENKKGIFSEKCTQTKNTNNPDCDIKGNARSDKIYYKPDCGFYNQVIVQLYLGDRWFCSEKEAIEAGYRKPSQCP